SAAASRSSSPFLTPAQPTSATVLTSWPGISLRNARGTHSSSSTRIGNQVSFRLLERGDGNVTRDGREVVKEFIQRMTALDVVDQRLHGDAGSDEHRGAAQDVRVGMNDGRFFHGPASPAVRLSAERNLADPGEPVEDNHVLLCRHHLRKARDVGAAASEK